MWRNRSYEPVRRIAFGHQSTVWLARDAQTRELVTIKATNLSEIESESSYNHLRNEQKTLELLARELNRPPPSFSVYKFPKSCLRVPKLLKVFHEAKIVTRLLSEDTERGVLYFVFEFIPGATLNKHVAVTKGLSEQTAKFYAAELIRIIAALHERGIIYRDLKASNIVVQPNGRLTLIDFGFAKYIGARGRTRSFCGTLHSMPPEILIKARCAMLLSESELPRGVGPSSLTSRAGPVRSPGAGPSPLAVGASEDSVGDAQECGALDAQGRSNRSLSCESYGEQLADRSPLSAATNEFNQQQPLIQVEHSFGSINDALTSHESNKSLQSEQLNEDEEESPKAASNQIFPLSRLSPLEVASGRNWSTSVLSSAEIAATVRQAFAIAAGPKIKVFQPESKDGCAQPEDQQPTGMTKSRGMFASISSPNFGEHEIGQAKLYLYPTDSYGAEVDWWGLGVIVYEMAFCRPPFGYYDYSVDRCQTIEQLAKRSPQSIVFPESPAISPECKDLIVNLLQADKSLRLGTGSNQAQAISDHPWFQNFPWNQLDDPAYFSPDLHVHQFDETDF